MTREEAERFRKHQPLAVIFDAFGKDQVEVIAPPPRSRLIRSRTSRSRARQAARVRQLSTYRTRARILWR